MITTVDVSVQKTVILKCISAGSSD